MVEKEQDALNALDSELRFCMSEWLSFEFPQYVPLLRDTDGRFKVIVGRLHADDGAEPVYAMSAYSSLAAKDRSMLWAAGGRSEDISFTKLRGVAEAYYFWYNALRKFFQTATGLTETDAHKLLVVFNHQDGKTFPAPICVFCYVLALQKKCQQSGINLTTENAKSELVEGDGQGGMTPPDVEKETSDTLDVDLE